MTFPAIRFSIKVKLCFFLGLISVLAYANTLRNGYAIDDFILIKSNVIVTKGMAAVPEIFSTPYFKGYLSTSFDYYRPLSLAMFAIEYDLFGDNPFVGHLVNILLFAGCVIVLFLFLDGLFEKKRTTVALIACLLFALHPVNTEVVANIKSRDQLLCFFFSFFAVNLFMKFMGSGRILHLITGFFLLLVSFFSKETAITFLVIIPFIFFFYRNENRKRALSITSSSFVAAAIYLAIRFSILRSVNGGTNSGFSFLDNLLAQAPDVQARVATEVLVLGKYLKLMLIPFPLICDYSYSTINFVKLNNFWVIISFVAYTALIVTGIYRLIKKPKDPYAFAILFYLMSIAVFSNVFFLIAGIMAERFLFFALIGFCLVPALLIMEWIGPVGDNMTAILKNQKAVLVTISVLLIYAAVTLFRNSEWHDNYTLFRADAKRAPANCRLQYNVGTNLVIASDTLQPSDPERMKMMTEGINYLKRAIGIYPDFALAYSEIANAYFHLLNYDSSEVYSVKALRHNPRDAFSMENLSAIYFKTGRFAQSLEVCRSAVALDTTYARGYRNMGNCFMRLNRFDSAIYSYKKAIVFEPDAMVSYERLAIAYKLSGNMDSANKYLEIAQMANPEFNY